MCITSVYTKHGTALASLNRRWRAISVKNAIRAKNSEAAVCFQRTQLRLLCSFVLWQTLCIFWFSPEQRNQCCFHHVCPARCCFSLSPAIFLCFVSLTSRVGENCVLPYCNIITNIFPISFFSSFSSINLSVSMLRMLQLIVWRASNKATNKRVCNHRPGTFYCTTLLLIDW